MSPVPTRINQNNRRPRHAIGNGDARLAARLARLIEHKTSVVITEKPPPSAGADRPEHLALISRGANTQYRHSCRQHYPHSAHNQRA
jgi:hypothetical protein